MRTERVTLILGLNGGSLASEGSKLIIHVIAFEVTQPIRARYINVRHKRTDRRTDRQVETTLVSQCSAR